jgi:hypothetical protein
MQVLGVGEGGMGSIHIVCEHAWQATLRERCSPPTAKRFRHEGPEPSILSH